MLKKILIGLGVVLGVLFSAWLRWRCFFDANKFKPKIERYVHDNYKRTLKFDGDLALSVFPRIAIALPPTTLSNLTGDRVSASLKDARISVALLPLLHSRIEVGAISIDGLTRRSNGGATAAPASTTCSNAMRRKHGGQVDCRRDAGLRDRRRRAH